MVVILIIAFLLLGVNSIVSGFTCITDGLFANPDDQHSFFHCSFSTPFLMQCPATLIWSQDKNSCDWNTNTHQRKYIAPFYIIIIMFMLENHFIFS
jgi:hypothetical protein